MAWSSVQYQVYIFSSSYCNSNTTTTYCGVEAASSGNYDACKPKWERFRSGLGSGLGLGFGLGLRVGLGLRRYFDPTRTTQYVITPCFREQPTFLNILSFLCKKKKVFVKS